MPVRPPQLEVRCPQCGWLRVWRPASDALTATDLPPDCCPRCHSADLQARPITCAPGLWGQLKQWLTSL